MHITVFFSGGMQWRLRVFFEVYDFMLSGNEEE
jgi:hypothetical protein